jgi:DNA-binding MarR family transcriptional regulator
MSSDAIDRPTMCRTSPEILQLLAAYCGHSRKPYTFPSQQTILNTLRQRYRLHISRRTLNRRLAHLEAAGMITRLRRHKRDQPSGRLLLRSTLYFVTSFGRRMLKKTVDNLSKFLTNIAVPQVAQKLSTIRSLVQKNLTTAAGGWPPGDRKSNAPPLRERDL